MRTGAEAEARGEWDAAEAAFRVAFDAGIGAAAAFSLAHLLADRDRDDEARTWHERARALDPGYARPFATPGVSEYLAGDLPAAERAFRRTLRLDNASLTAHVGLGWLAGRRSDWQTAEAEARRALALHADDIDALRLMARALEAQHRDRAAIDAYERSLIRALAGGESLDAIVATASPPHALRDTGHGQVHARLGRLYEREGDRPRAVTAYRLALAAGYQRAWVKRRMARCDTARALRS
jgi:tetratricopeptide (TPR) repeat protein